MRINNGIQITIASMVLCVSAQAAEYSVTPYAQTRVDTDTNRRLIQDSDTTYGATVEAGAAIAIETEDTTIAVTPSVRVARFTDDGTNTDQDNEEFFIDILGNRRVNERFTVGGFLNFENTGVIGSELDDQGLVIDTDKNFSRKAVSLGPSLTYILSERDSLRFDLTYSDTSYENNQTSLTDFSVYSANLSWTRQLTESDRIIASAFITQQDPELSFLVLSSAGPNPELLESQVDTFGGRIGYVHSFSDTLSGSLSVGVRNSESDFPRLVTAFLDGGGNTIRIYDQGHTESTGLLFDASLEKQFERTTVTVSASRSASGTGTGLNQERDDYSIGARHLFSDRLTGNTSLQYFETTLEDGTDGNAIDQIRYVAGLDWEMTEFWTLGGGYTYRHRSSDTSESAEGHGGYLNVRYNGDKYAISR